MFEKVNPTHPDKIADRIAGAVVDLAYRQTKNPRIAVEVLIGHKVCNIIAETSVSIPENSVIEAAQRIAGNVHVVFRQLPQDTILAENQSHGLRCGADTPAVPISARRASFVRNIGRNGHRTRFAAAPLPVGMTTGGGKPEIVSSGSIRCAQSVSLKTESPRQQ